MLGTWLGRIVGAGVVAGLVVACSSSSKDTSGGGGGGDDDGGSGSDASTTVTKDAGSDASVNNRMTNDAGQCTSNCHEGDPCATPDQCASGICTASVCVDPSCTDGKMDGTETAPDCGGICSACADGLACIVGGDCESGVCDGTTKLCDAPTATDGVENGSETDVDCGDSGTGEQDNAPPCAGGLMCKVASDCIDKECGPAGKCIPATCSDGIQNGTETAKDCGGDCNGCADGIACLVDTDCTSKSCDVSGTKLCLAPTNMDGIMNGNETDVDCGSGGTGETTNAGPCVDGKMCVVGKDCVDLVCTTANGVSTCAPESCTDGVQNGFETGKDCGSIVATGCPACGDGLGCNVASDCQSLSCNTKTNICLVATDTDGITNGKESDIDCGSSGTGTDNTKAPVCPDINATTKKISLCSAGTDCKSTYCNTVERQCVDAQSCSLPAKASATGIMDVITHATPTSEAAGMPNANGAGLIAGIDTCGVGEATADPTERSLESCCKSLDIAVPSEGTIRIDKYEVTSGRMRQFIESINALEGDYDLQKWVMAQFSAAGAPLTTVGTTLAAQIPTIQSGVTDTRYLYPSSSTGVLNVVQQLGGTSIDSGVPSELQGCFVGPGAAGSSTYWFDQAMSATVGSPPRNFTQDYYDIKSQNCAPYWMAAAFCAWDGGRLPTNAEIDTLWGTATYPWGAISRNYQDLGGDATWQAKGFPVITDYTIDNLNDTSAFEKNGMSNAFFYYYPRANTNPATGPLGALSIVDTVDTSGNPQLNLSDFSPYIASPGRFTQDVTSLVATGVYAGDAWYDLAANLFEFKAIPPANLTNNNGIFCDTTGGQVLATSATCPAMAGQVVCSRGVYNSNPAEQTCGVVRGSGLASAPVSRMPNIQWQGGSWEVHAIPTGGNPNSENNYYEPMNAQYGKTGFRCARPAE